MERRAEGIEAGKAELAADHRLMREAAPCPAILLGDGRAEEPRRARLGPDLAAVHAGRVPRLELRHIFGRDEAARLLLQEHDVLGHPGRAREIENAHLLLSSTVCRVGKIARLC
jgi:hypothetical protein